MKSSNSEPKTKRVVNHKDLLAYEKGMASAMKIFELSKQFSKEEMFSLTDQIRRSSRSVCANLAEAWRKRRYEKAFIAKLSDVEAEAAETQVWIEFAVKCNYLETQQAKELYKAYAEIIALTIGMIKNAKKMDN